MAPIGIAGSLVFVLVLTATCAFPPQFGPPPAVGPPAPAEQRAGADAGAYEPTSDRDVSERQPEPDERTPQADPGSSEQAPQPDPDLIERAPDSDAQDTTGGPDPTESISPMPAEDAAEPADLSLSASQEIAAADSMATAAGLIALPDAKRDRVERALDLIRRAGEALDRGDARVAYSLAHEARLQAEQAAGTD